jgi:2-dehydro-3-deoxy-D-gluconate 5-dehydrogenase
MSDGQSLFDLTGRVAVVTGGNGGIGFGLASGLARAGATVIIAARDEEKSAASVAAIEEAGGLAAAVPVDVGDEASIAAMVDAVVSQFGDIAILVANAGINLRKRPEDYTLEEWNRIVDTNLSGPFLCAKAVYPTLKARGGGKIITIGSMSSIFGLPFAAAYSASKGGVVQLTRALASAWAADNIQVNAILPGWIDTDLTKAARSQVAGLEERITARTPAGRWGGPEDLSGVGVFLASSASDFVTGVALPVDGGYSIQG